MALREKELKERLSLSQEEVDYIKQHLMDICPYSDKVTEAYKESIRSGKSLDQIIDEMTDAQFEDLCREVFDLSKKAGIWLKKKKKKQEAEEETESESDSDAESDSDTEGSEEATAEQEAEQECSQNE